MQGHRHSVAIGGLARLVTASGLSNLADGVFQVALPLLALTITRDPGAFALVTLIGRLPWLLVALPAGALADRLDRRRTMVIVNLGRSVVIAVLGLAATAGLDSLWPLYLAAFALGTAETLFDTAAQSILPNIVGDPDRLTKANGRIQATELVANQFVGPPLGALIAGVMLAGALFASAGSYVLSALVLITLSGTFRPRRDGPPTRLGQDIVEGVRYLFGHRLLRVLGLCVGLANLASTGMLAILPLFLIEPGPVGLSELGYGLILTTFAAGALIGTQLTEWIERRLGSRRAMLAATVSFPLFSLGPALTTDVVWLVVIFLGAGALSISWNVITVSLRQRIVPDHLLGRVNAGYRLLAWGSMPLGAGLGGLVANWFGLTAAFWTTAAISALCFPLVALGTSRAQIDGSTPAPRK